MICGDVYVFDFEWCVKFVVLYVSFLWLGVFENLFSLDVRVKRVVNYIVDLFVLKNCVLNFDI